VTAFDIIDRYDIAGWFAIEVVAGVALVLGAPLWVAPILMLAAGIASFIRHFDEMMGP
jgi:hypothetical protein